jgi:Glycosyl hydrolases family 2, TIM barrel domain/Glycosyl hydrolases family 2, sugar binding domain/Glycosyl hydrolases family 2/Beta galactosidase small chain
MKIEICALVLCLFVAGEATAQESQWQYLSGKGTDDALNWDFFCSAGDNSGQWATLPVPSCWDMQGFGKLSYQSKGLGEQGKYRHHFSVPAAWADHSIYLVFDGSMTDTQAFINGQNAGPIHQGAYYRFKYDVTHLVKVGADNLLEVTVDKESANKSVNDAERRGDYWNYGGIFRPVYLESAPVQHIDRIAINAKADGTFAMEAFTLDATSANQVQAQIVDARGNRVGESFTGSVAAGIASLKTKIDSPLLWTAETPNLYSVDVTLLQGNDVVHRIHQKFGFRTIEVRTGDGVYVNGQRILLKGTDRHSFWPESGRATNEKISRGDVALMKEMNNNAVRMSHYPPDEHFLNTCDEQGIYVLDELAGWHKSYDTPTGQGLIEEMVTGDVNHPSIIFWDNGNEGGWNTAVDDDFAKWDPQQRNVLHPWAEFRDVSTKHYPTYDTAVKLSNGPDVFFPTEFQHALFDGGGGTALEDYWDVIRHGKTSAGGFIWAFLDETVKRKDEDGKMDSAGNRAPDGVLGPYRQKEASFFTIKQVWSPIVVRETAPGELTVENRYDFINTNRCSFTWEARAFHHPQDQQPGHTVVASGRIPPPNIAPHEQGQLRIEPVTTGADALALRVDDPQGRELWTWVWPLPKTADANPAKGTNNKISKTEDADEIHFQSGSHSVSFSKATGYLASATQSGRKFSLLNGPRLAVGDATLKNITSQLDGQDCVVKATYAGNLKSVQWRIEPSGWIQLDYAYNLVGTYDFFGVSFDLPDDKLKSKKWLGKGPYRVWKNRIPGGILDVWENQYNSTQTGYTDWIYPEFKGYFANVRWMQLQTTDGPILVELQDPSLFIQVLKADFPAHPKPVSPTTAALKNGSQSATMAANAWTSFPDAGFSILNGIAPMGNKFNIAPQLGPQSQQNVAAGDYHETVRFYFGENQ